ncbi:MAG: NrpR regulatory domain-containing protein [Lentisphaeria bacterium]
MTSRDRIAILRALRDAGGTTGSAEIARHIQGWGVDLGPRAVRLHLQELETAGLVAPGRRGRGGGRKLTARGMQSLQDAPVLDRVGLTAARMDSLAYRMTFNPRDPEPGLIVLNMTLIDEANFQAAVEEMVPVFEAGLGMGERIGLFRPNESAGLFQIPPGRIGLGTLCSVTLNGALLNERIPVSSRFAGILELHHGEPVRFTDIIHYDGTSLDPLEIFIRSGLTRVHDAVRTGSGRIGASFREVPTCALGEVERLLPRLKAVGVGGVLMLGRPNQPLLGFPVQEGRTGLVVAGGLNPCAVIHEAGLGAEHTAMAQLFEYRLLRHYRELAIEAGVATRM